MDNIRAHEISLTEYTISTLHQRFGDRINIHGPSSPLERGGVFSFDFDGLHPHDISQVLDQHAVCVRAGHHCAKPLMKLLGIGATARASVYVYNDTADIDALADDFGPQRREMLYALGQVDGAKIGKGVVAASKR